MDGEGKHRAKCPCGHETRATGMERRLKVQICNQAMTKVSKGHFGTGTPWVIEFPRSLYFSSWPEIEQQYYQ